MKMRYGNLWVHVLDKDHHARTCGYWYLVTEGSMAHTAYRTFSGLSGFLAERGLKLTEKLTAPGHASSQRIEGEYETEMHMDKKAFDEIEAIWEMRVLSNGEYTLGKVTRENGINTVHTLNPNVKEREVFDYQESREIYN
jgi:hypothetical protein